MDFDAAKARALAIQDQCTESLVRWVKDMNEMDGGAFMHTFLRFLQEPAEGQRSKMDLESRKVLKRFAHLGAMVVMQRVGDDAKANPED